MAFEPLLDSWNQSRQYRTDLTPGERCGSIEHLLDGVMDSFRHTHWTFIDSPRASQQREP